MKCDKCGFNVNVGDQICINCGQKLSVKNAIIPEIDKVQTEVVNKKGIKNKLVIYSVFCAIILLIVFIILGILL